MIHYSWGHDWFGNMDVQAQVPRNCRSPVFILVKLDPLQAIPPRTFLLSFTTRSLTTALQYLTHLFSNFWMCTLRLGSRVRSGWSFLRRVIFPPTCNSVRVLAPKAILVLTVSTCHPKFASWLLVWVQLLGDWLGCWKKSLEKQNSWCLETKKQVATYLTGLFSIPGCSDMLWKLSRSNHWSSIQQNAFKSPEVASGSML